jgi:hypothetical protein
VRVEAGIDDVGVGPGVVEREAEALEEGAGSFAESAFERRSAVLVGYGGPAGQSTQRDVDRWWRGERESPRSPRAKTDERSEECDSEKTGHRADSDSGEITTGVSPATRNRDVVLFRPARASHQYAEPKKPATARRTSCPVTLR